MFGDNQEAAVEVEEVRAEEEVEEQEEAALVPHQHEEGLGAAHQALLQREGPTGFQAFTRPPCFGARIAGLLGLMVISWVYISLLCGLQRDTGCMSSIRQLLDFIFVL